MAKYSPPTLSPLYHSCLLRPGERHLRDGLSCQDHTLTRDAGGTVVLAVADGASRYINTAGVRTASNNQCGAILVAELAVRAASDALLMGRDLDAVHMMVAIALYDGLRPLWDMLGIEQGSGILTTTLLLAIVGERESVIFASGDGAWGMYLPSETDLDGLHTHRPAVTSERGGLISVNAFEHTPLLRATCSTETRHGPSAVARSLRPVMRFKGPIVGAWIATDGILNEPAFLSAMHRTPPRNKATLEASLVRPPESDDLATAWAVTRFPSDAEAEASVKAKVSGA